MRITNRMLFENLSRHIATNVETMATQQDHISAGKRILRPSDDAIGIGRVLNLRQAIGISDQYVYNSDDTVTFLEQTEIALKSLGDTLADARERIVEAANQPLSEDDRKDIAGEVDQFIDTVISAGNQEEGSRFIFAGYQTLAPPFVPVYDAYGRVTSVNYMGDDGQLLREILTDTVVPANMTGRDVFIGQTHTVTGDSGIGAGNETAVLNTLPLGLSDSTFTINGVTFNVDVSTNTLQQVADRITRDDNAHVRATIDGSGRLILTSNNSSQVMDIQQVSGNFLLQMGILDVTPGTGALGAGTTADVLTGVTTTATAGLNAGTITLTTTVGIVDPGSVVWTPDPVAGGTPTAAQQAQLDALNLGGVDLTNVANANVLSEFGITLDINAAPLATTGTTEIAIGAATSNDIIVGEQLGPQNILDTLIKLRDDLLAPDDAYFDPTITINSTTNAVTNVTVAEEYRWGMYSIGVDASGNVVPNTAQFSPLYDGLPPSPEQQAQLDALNQGGMPLTTDALSEFGISLLTQVPPSGPGTVVFEVSPVVRNLRPENLSDLGLTVRVPGAGIIEAWGEPTDGRAGTHRLTVSNVALGAATLTGQATALSGVTNVSGQNAGTLRITTDANGLALANSVVWQPDNIGGRAPTAAQQAQLDALNVGGVPLTANALDQFGITLTPNAGGPPFTAGMSIVTIAPTTATVTDEFFPNDGTAMISSTDTITANAINELTNAVPGTKIMTADLLEGGSSIITSTSRIGEMDFDLDRELRQHAEVGARYNRVQTNWSNLQNDILSFKGTLSKIEDLDVASAVVEYRAQENVYQAALAVGARIILPTLLDFLT